MLVHACVELLEILQDTRECVPAYRRREASSTLKKKIHPLAETLPAKF